MKRIALLIAASLAVGGSAYAGTKPKAASPKHDAIVKCDTPVSEFLADMPKSEHNAVSPLLTDKQYAFAKKTLKDHSKVKEDMPGDSAVIIAMGGEFAVLLTKGIGDEQKLCAIAPVPSSVVLQIMEAEGGPTSSTTDNKPKTPKGDWL